MHIPQKARHAALRLPSLLPDSDLFNTCRPLQDFHHLKPKLLQSIASQNGQVCVREIYLDDILVPVEAKSIDRSKEQVCQLLGLLHTQTSRTKIPSRRLAVLR